MSGLVAWVNVGLALGVLGVRRVSIAVAFVTAQALVLVAVALADAGSQRDVVAAGALTLRALALGSLFFFVVARTREERPVHARVSPLTRAAFAVALALALVWLVPAIGLDSRGAERSVLAVVAIGITTAALRHATIFQVLGIVLVENALALAALELPGGASLAIELGVTLDLLLVTLVATVFHAQIFAEFGAGDSAELRTLRD